MKTKKNNLDIKIIKKYSKSSEFYLETNKTFLSDNNILLKKSIKLNLLYKSQPIRKTCKICRSVLNKKVDFNSHGVEYIFCKICFHLNGLYEDTESYVKSMYISSEGDSYSLNYLDRNYLDRVRDIYDPKLNFLLKSIPMKKINILDVGCGSGYFVYAALKRNIDASGIDVNKTMIDFGKNQINNLIGKRPLINLDENGFLHKIKSTDANIVSAIGVIEHLRNPHEFFDAFKKSNAKFIYYSVPMVSFSVALENIFSYIFPRHLSAGHTHLFSEDSINKMHSIMEVKSLAEWRFGTDILDLYRSFLISLKRQKCSKNFIKFFGDNFSKTIDELQFILDKNHFCSEIHILASK